MAENPAWDHNWPCHAPRERVSWNLLFLPKPNAVPSHAPRERVSWNLFQQLQDYLQNVTLHVSVWVEIQQWCHSSSSQLTSRSTWACELKLYGGDTRKVFAGHAPRERVSWNRFLGQRLYQIFKVTLHVSVWVEIVNRGDLFVLGGESRSTWACELKLMPDLPWIVLEPVTLHVSVWVEISDTERTILVFVKVTLHVSVWVEISNLIAI